MPNTWKSKFTKHSPCQIFPLYCRSDNDNLLIEVDIQCSMGNIKIITLTAIFLITSRYCPLHVAMTISVLLTTTNLLFSTSGISDVRISTCGALASSSVLALRSVNNEHYIELQHVYRNFHTQAYKRMNTSIDVLKLTRQ